MFTVLRPEETGLDRTIFISGWKECPAFIVDAQNGVNFEPSSGSRTYVIGEMTGNHDIDQWLKMNKDIISGYQKQLIDATGLIKQRPFNAKLNDIVQQFP